MLFIAVSEYKIAGAYLTVRGTERPNGASKERLTGSSRRRSFILVHLWSTKESVMADAPARRKVTINTLNAKMKRGEPITQLAAYDYRTAVISDRLGMVIFCFSPHG